MRRRQPEIVGLIWRWDRIYPLSREEAEYWDRHVLPYGWAIVRDERPLP